MPSRWASVSIVLFWLTTTSWLLWFQFEPYVRPHEPPAIDIELIDEVQQHDNKTEIYWEFHTEDQPDPGQRHYLAKSWIDYQEKPEESFTFQLLFETISAKSRLIQLGPFGLRRLTSSYRITRQGQLQAMSSHFTLDSPSGTISTDLTGNVREQMFHSSYRFTFPLGTHQAQLPVVPIAQQGSVLLPLHPINKIRGLRPGQTWRQPLFNPFADALRATGSVLESTPQSRELFARVLPELHDLPGWKTRAPCLVIEYDGDPDGTNPRTWVHAATGYVLRQEATVFDKRLLLQRVSIPETEP